jgi:acetylornithine deacetylase/succinyl-diaminopimelate desuccinylase-like protein
MTPVDRTVVDLLAELVTIDSVNPSLSPGAPGEAEIARHVHGWAVAHGLRAEIVDDDGRPNVLVHGGAADGPRLLLCAHLDTVGTGGMVDPLTPRIDGDRLYGRGAYDMKAGLAAALVACREADRLGLPAQVVVAAVADEESDSRGIQRLLPGLIADVAIVTEPTEMVAGVAHKGFVWMDVEVTGVAAHGSRPELGVDAITKTGPILVALEELNRALATRHHALLGPGTVHASLIAGGQEASTIPERCLLTLERRTLPDETVADVEAEIARLLDGCRAADPQLAVTARTLLHRPAMETAPDADVVRDLATAHRHVRRRDVEIGGMSYWADSAFLSAHGIPTVLFGPGGEGAHADVEWVSLADTVDCARILVEVARALSRRAPARESMF